MTKQRKPGRAQRSILELLGKHGPMTIAELSALRNVANCTTESALRVMVERSLAVKVGQAVGRTNSLQVFGLPGSSMPVRFTPVGKTSASAWSRRTIPETPFRTCWAVGHPWRSKEAQCPA